MYAIVWRHNANSPWNVLKDVVPSEQDARAEINKYGRYDMVKRDYRIVALGDADAWIDPYAQDAAADASKGDV